MSTSEGKVQPEDVTFFSDGVKIAGDLFVPIGSDPAPGVIIAHGFGGLKEFFVGDIAAALCHAGFVALTFDYRGYGLSEGLRDRLFPMEQVADVLAAATYLRNRSEVDAERVSVYGTSFGGGIAIAAAALDRSMRSAVSVAGIADCRRWLQSLRRNWEWIEFQHALEEDRLRRVLTGHSAVVEPEFIMVRDPTSEKHEAYLRERWPARAFRLNLASGDAISDFVPGDFAAELAPCALLLIGVDEDGLTAFDQTEELYARATHPKELVVLSGLTHHEIYQPQHLPSVMNAVVEFVRKYS